MATAKCSCWKALRELIRQRATARGSKVEFAGTEDDFVDFVHGIAGDAYLEGLVAGKAKSAPRVGASRRSAGRQMVS